MTKLNVTRKWVYNNFDNIITVPYCTLHDLLKDLSPQWYTSGTYGWNADIYCIDMETCIVTGYRPFGNIKPTFATNNDANKAAARTNDPRIREILLREYVERVLSNV